jgi:tRNA(Ile)-lysidine synthase
MSAPDKSLISVAEAEALFASLRDARALVLAVSGGPDSTALLWLMARWRKRLKAKPNLLAVTVDHGLRKEAKREAAQVGKLARKLGVSHRVMKWRGVKPRSGIQEKARQARYALLSAAAKQTAARHIVTAHTLDDQAETVLMRMARGSGVSGLAGMARESRLGGLTLVRPLLDIPKTRLVASLTAAKVAYAEDPSNVDPRFTRPRLRKLTSQLAAEGLDARRLAALARRLRRADAALEAEVGVVMASFGTQSDSALVIPAADFDKLPAEIALRLLARAINCWGNEGPAELGKLEALLDATLAAAQAAPKTAFRRTLAGALVSIDRDKLTIEQAPARRQSSLTKRGIRRPNAGKTR